MNVETRKQNICINRNVIEKKEIVLISEDEIVPDSKPDILSVVATNGNICIYKKEVFDDKIKMDGCINTYVMYLPDSKEDNLRALNFNIDFSKNIQVIGAKKDMELITECEIKNIECKVINGRKINVKIEMDVMIKLFQNEEIQIIDKIEENSNLQVLKSSMDLNSTIGTGKTTVYAKDTINIDLKDELAEIMNTEINLINRDIKLSYNKVLTKAEAEVKIMYLTEDNRICKVIGIVPIVGFIDIQNIADNNICDINYEIKNIVIKANPAEEHSIYIELEIEPMCIAYELKKIDIIQDLYSPVFNTDYSTKRINTNIVNKEFNDNIEIKEKVKIQGINESSLIDMVSKLNLTDIKINKSKIMYSGDLELNFIISNENVVSSRSINIPIKFDINNQANTENCEIDSEVLVKNITIDSYLEDGVNLNIELDIRNKIGKNVDIKVLDNIQILEEKQKDNYDSYIIYIVKPGDTLWKIAKKFNSTVDEIKLVNKIENVDVIDVGEKIYIPRFNCNIEKNIEMNNKTEILAV